MAELSELLDAAIEQGTDAAFEAASNSRKYEPDLVPALDVAIGMTGADMGTLQRYVESKDCLELVASCGFSSEAQSLFNVVHRDTNTTCEAALTQRMRGFVEDVSRRAICSLARLSLSCCRPKASSPASPHR